jgi:hypothetical protein
VLVAVWEVSDRLCGKLLKPVMADLLLSLERHGELMASEEVRVQLLTISAASIDRLLRIHKRDVVRQPHRKPPHPSSLKGQVPVRTWSEWSGVQPGSVQADLVLHCGESTQGFYLTTLCVIDVATGWTELEAVWGLGQTASPPQSIRPGAGFPSSWRPSTRTMALSSSTRLSSAIAAGSRSPSRAAAATRRTTRPTSSSATISLSGAWSVMTV